MKDRPNQRQETLLALQASPHQLREQPEPCSNNSFATSATGTTRTLFQQQLRHIATGTTRTLFQQQLHPISYGNNPNPVLTAASPQQQREQPKSCSNSSFATSATRTTQTLFQQQLHHISYGNNPNPVPIAASAHQLRKQLEPCSSSSFAASAKGTTRTLF